MTSITAPLTTVRGVFDIRGVIHVYLLIQPPPRVFPHAIITEHVKMMSVDVISAFMVIVVNKVSA